MSDWMTSTPLLALPDPLQLLSAHGGARGIPDCKRDWLSVWFAILWHEWGQLVAAVIPWSILQHGYAWAVKIGHFFALSLLSIHSLWCALKLYRRGNNTFDFCVIIVWANVDMWIHNTQNISWKKARTQTFIPPPARIIVNNRERPCPKCAHCLGKLSFLIGFQKWLSINQKKSTGE